MKINKIKNKIITDSEKQIQTPDIMEFEGNWPNDVKSKFLTDMIVLENFISPDDELGILGEIENYLKRMR